MSDEPKIKRGLSMNEIGQDVLAVQRAVTQALTQHGMKSINAQNGVYGDNSVLDVASWQHIAGIPATGRVGQPTLDSLWPYFDAYGESLYFKAKIGKPAALPAGKLVTGMQGDRVRAAQQMLWRALGIESQNLRNGVYGDGVEADVRIFQGIADLPVTHGDKIDLNLWAMLWGFGDAYAQDLAQDAPSVGAAIRSTLITLAEQYVRFGGQYTQSRPYQHSRPLVAPLYNDCSGSIHALYYAAYGPDPSDRGFDGYGYTGTMQEQGTRYGFDEVKAGDCVFYGVQAGGIAAHVAMILDGGRLFTFGHTPPTITMFADYWRNARRSDIGARRYLPS